MAYILLGRGKSSSCGGFLIREDFVLTAAHCQAQEYHVIIGAHNIEENETSQKVINVKKAFPHPLSKNFENDIMLLKLIKPVVLNREVAVIPLRSRSVAPGTVCSVAGWGKVNQSKSSSNSILQEVNVTVQNYEQCRSTWGGQYDDRKICAGRPDHGTCKLERNASLNSQVGIAPLPQEEHKVKVGSSCWLAGWGATDPDGYNSSSTLKAVELTVVRDLCKQNWRRQFNEFKICASRPMAGGCKGDSGAPLVCKGVVEGVLSSGGMPCGFYPSMFTRVSVYLDWIAGILVNN
ncbi:DDN1 protein, partial [Amia calva]|nr:DDN1 protein [Amia calva]